MKKNRLTNKIFNKDKSDMVLDDLIKEVQEGKLSEFVRMNFEVERTLKKAFKSKVAMKEENVKNVLANLMKMYLEEK